MPFRALLFDLDGTLLDTLRDIAESVNAVLIRSGYRTHEIDAYRYFVGDGSVNLARRALPESSRNNNTVNAVVQAIDEEYNRHWADHTTPYKGVPEMLDTLTSLGMRKCILSNKSQKFTEMTVARFLPRWHFDIVVGAQPGIPLKPDPAAALSIARQLDIKPDDFLYVGDTATDMKTAIAAGMFPVGALWGFRTAAELKDAGARDLVRSPLDILSFI
jgi:phosphoglycolate phosphatase